MTFLALSINRYNCTYDPPTDRPYITRTAWDRFRDKSDPSWGRLTFSLEPWFSFAEQLHMYDETFIRGVSVYVPGGKVSSYWLVRAWLSQQQILHV